MIRIIFTILFLLITSCATKESGTGKKTNEQTTMQNLSVVTEKPKVVNDSNPPAALIEKRFKYGLFQFH